MNIRCISNTLWNFFDYFHTIIHERAKTTRNNKKIYLGIELLPQVFFIQIMVLSKNQQPMFFFFDEKIGKFWEKQVFSSVNLTNLPFFGEINHSYKNNLKRNFGKNKTTYVLYCNYNMCMNTYLYL
jgi:hypothetical protein